MTDHQDQAPLDPRIEAAHQLADDLTAELGPTRVEVSIRRTPHTRRPAEPFPYLVTELGNTDLPLASSRADIIELPDEAGTIVHQTRWHQDAEDHKADTAHDPQQTEGAEE